MKKRKKLSLGPVFAIMIITLVIILISVVFSFLQVRADKTEIVNGYLETSVVSVKNILSMEGLKYLFGNYIMNLALFEPLFLLIISLIGIGIGEKSGLFKAIFSPLKRVKVGIITAAILLISIVATIIGEYSFAILLPFAGVVYRYIGKNPVLGVLTAFIGITGGYAAGFMINYDTFTLGKLTEIAARVEVDKTYNFALFSSVFIKIAATFIITILGTIFINTILSPKLPKVKVEVEEELETKNKSALLYSNFTFFLMLMLFLYAIIPGIPGGGFLLDKKGNTYIEMLLNDNSPFRNSILYIITMMLMICGYIYGRVSNNIKDSTDYSVGLSKSFDNLGYVFVLMFFASQMIGILNWTNLGDVLASWLITLLSHAQFSGILLIIVTFVMILILSLIIPGTLEKWVLASPIIVPLFMRANITPEFTQVIFQVADGLGKSITPIFPYFIVLVAFLEKYDTNEHTKTTVFGTIKLILPTILMLILVWLVILIGWYIIGLPIGINGFPTL
jgi:Putative p-aminobenzoyl-glutamate transporter